MKTKTFKKGIALFIAEGAYSGRFPFAPGTAGSLVAVLLYLLLKRLPLAGYLVVCLLVTGIAIWASDEAEKALGEKDPHRVVIDEIAGYLISMILLPSTWGYIIGAFLLFRIFDVIKPYPLHRLQSLPGGWGIVVDDVGAGIYTNIVLQIVLRLSGKG